MNCSRDGRAISVFAAVVGLACLMGSIGGCRQKVREPVSISFVDPEWSNDTQKPRSTIMRSELDEFTRKTGIVVNLLPAPEGTREQMKLVREGIALFERFAEVTGLDGYDISLRQQGYLWLTTSQDGVRRQRTLIERRRRPSSNRRARSTTFR